MRFISTEESVKRGEPSVLAILETLFAVGLSCWIAVSFQMWWHLLIACIVAPLALLTTPLIGNLSWSFTSKINKFLEEHSLVTVLLFVFAIGFSCSFVIFHDSMALGILSYVILAFSFFTGLFQGLVGRLSATLYGIITQPLETLAELPSNWWKQIACTDIMQPSRLIAKFDGTKDDLRLLKNKSNAWMIYMDSWSPVQFAVNSIEEHKMESKAFKVMIVFSILILLVPVLIVSLALRYSLKSTCIVWLPLVWAIKPIVPHGEPLRANLRVMAMGDTYRIVKFLSYSVLIFAMMKGVFWILMHDLALKVDAWSGQVENWLGPRFAILGDFCAIFVRPGEIPIWQIASTINAILAIGTYYVVRHWYLRMESGLPVDEVGAERKLSTVYFVRRLLTSYAIICNGIMLYHLAAKLPLPAISSKMFPAI